MANYYVQLPAQNANAMADFSGLNRAVGNLGETFRNNGIRAERQDERAYQRGRDARADARADETYAEQRDTRKKAAMSGFVQQHIVTDQDPASRAAKWGKFLSINPNAASLPQAYHDPQYGPDLILSEAGVDPLEREYKQAQINSLNKRAEGGADFTKRETAARAYGLDPSSDAGRAFILTGRLPREDQQALTATDKKAILEADEMVSINRAAMTALGEASQLSPKAYDGALASQRSWLANNFWPGATPEAEATASLDNAVVGNALSQLKAIFGAAPTEGERKILLDLQGSANQPHNVRMEIYRRANAAAEKRLAFNEQRAAQLRGGTYYKPQGDAGPQPAPSGIGGAPIRARNPQTGEQIEWNGQQWVPVQ